MPSINKNLPTSLPSTSNDANEAAKAPRLTPATTSPEQALAAELALMSTPAAATTPRGAALGRQQAAKAAETSLPVVPRSQASVEQFHAAQVGYQRLGRKRARGVELDDVTQGPIPLPLEEVGEQGGDQQPSLAQALAEMDVQASQLAELCGTEPQATSDMQSLLANLVNITAKPTAEDMARLEVLAAADATPAHTAQVAALQAQLQRLLGEAWQDLPPGAALLVASLQVAGLDPNEQAPQATNLVSVTAPSSAAQQQAQKLAAGMQTLVQRSQQAVRDARTMSSDIRGQLAVQRTFVPTKR